jgi:hypothetical protein
LRDQVIIEELKGKPEDGHNPILGFCKTFKKYLIIDLEKEGFADLYAQTITYGLFAARTRCRGEFHRKNALEFIPQTIGLLHDLFGYISVGQAPDQLEWIIDDIAEVLASVDVGIILNQFYQEGKGEDPIVHFYETFLSEYDPQIREKRGVYYTPEPVVSFIVRSVHRILKEHFGKPDGLADIHIKILDPAAGTLTFTADYRLFIELAKLGRALADIHLMKSSELDDTFARFEKAGTNQVQRVKYDDPRVFINNDQYFSPIPPEIWQYRIGGYQVMHKWLKDRKGRSLSLEDIQHYIRISQALQLTIRCQEKIDHLYPQVEENLLNIQAPTT